MPMHTKSCRRTWKYSSYPVGGHWQMRIMRCSDSCGVSRIWVMVVGLALQLSFSSLPSSSCSQRLHQRNTPLHYTRGHFGPLHLTGASTNAHLGHRNSFSISPSHIFRSLRMITLLISSTSSCYY